MKARRVHGRGMLEPVRLVSVDAGGCICAVALLEPRRFVRTPAAYVLELPLGASTPAPGARLEAEPILGGWPDA